MTDRERKTKRSSFDSVVGVLKILSDSPMPLGIAHVLYRANISYTQSKYYLGILERNGLADKASNSPEYKITKKGKTMVELLSTHRTVGKVSIMDLGKRYG